MRTLIPLTLLAALLAAPLALAQEDRPKDETEPADGGNAWVEDCPPDMMCAYGGGAQEGVDCTDKADSFREECADCAECPKSYGGPDCIECSGMPRGSCMDGRECDMSDCPNCRTLDGPGGAPAEGGPIDSHADAETASAGANEVPGLALAGVLGAFAVAILVAYRRQ